MRQIKPVAMLAVAALLTMGTVYAQESPGQDSREMTVEQRQAAREAHRVRRENMSEEQRAAARKRFENMSEEDRQAMRQRRQNMSQEDRQAMRARWQNMSEEGRKALRERRELHRNQHPGSRNQGTRSGPPQDKPGKGG